MNRQLVLATAIALGCCSSCCCTGAKQQQQQQQQGESALHRRLLSNYDRSSRPAVAANVTVNVTFSVKVNRLVDLDEKNQILHVSLVAMQSWQDERLSWQPGDFSGLRHSSVPAASIWLPDVYLFNNAAQGDEGFLHQQFSRVSVSHDGWVLWTVAVTVHSSCSVDVLYFPFDHQVCELHFASWTHEMRQLRLSAPHLPEAGVDSSEMDEHSELEVTRLSLQQRQHTVKGMRQPVLVLRVHIRRKPLYYYYTVIAPSIMLCVLTLFSFCLPCRVAERIEIGLNVFLFTYFLQLLIAENTPESNATPVIGIFLTVVMTFNSFSLVMGTVVMHLHSRGDQDPCPEVPHWAWALCQGCLGPLTCSRLELRAPPLANPGSTFASCSRRRLSSKVDQQVEAAKWRHIAEVADKFLFELYLVCIVLSALLVLHLLPAINARGHTA